MCGEEEIETIEQSYATALASKAIEWNGWEINLLKDLIDISEIPLEDALGVLQVPSWQNDRDCDYWEMHDLYISV